MKKLLLVFILLSSIHCFSQEPRKLSGRPPVEDDAQRNRQNDTNSFKKGEKDSLPSIDLYKIISIERDTTHLDTSLTIMDDYKFNYLRKDNFELLPFSNTGQTYNSLSLRKDYTNAFPELGARARHFNFFEVEDIDYYYVPTPWTELYFKTVPEQGQQLDAFFTINTSKNFNMFVAYKGVRALGKYQHILTSSGNLRMGFSYDSNNERYHAKAHFVSQDLLNQENGGLTDQAMEQYIAKEPEFDDRSVLQVNFEDAESILFGKRFFLDHQYELTNPADSINSLSVAHTFDYSYKKFQFDQETAENDIFGESFEAANLRDETRLEVLFNEASVNYSNRLLGELSFKAGHTNYDYGYNSVYIRPGDTIGNRLSGNLLHVGAYYKKQYGGFEVEAEGRLNLADEFSGNFLKATASYEFDKENSILFGINQNSSAPNFNFLLHQSNYVNYNWQNNFDNEISQRLFADFSSKKLLDLYASLSQIENYSYFGLNEEGFVKPMQAGEQVRYLKLRAEKEFDLGLFGSYNTIMYQNVLEGTGVLNLPEFTTRNSIYYKDYWFDQALYLQTGFTFKYFTKYKMDGYDPILAEFYTQNSQELGEFPVVDFFFNAKVDKARIFLTLQHVNDLIDGNNNFSAPGYPYTDFLVRFGLVWDLFL
ncbi:putative beta-barrel porin [Christiangramia gaetbulicola]|uniref:Putative beta-barrel porin n=1 Tax=Christiangramia gaetbulicola TaxID=703340 RepID=A0A2T6AD40_9FLAO|nr:putative porin [Christiangramia gaetbulicola]PTX41735.1 putative beta-barrel porin [Christiangramia gaetbulicola]